MSEVARFLRQSPADGPDRFAGFALTDDERAMLAAQSPASLALLRAALDADEPLADVGMVIRLSPRMTRTPDGKRAIQYMASLQPEPGAAPIPPSSAGGRLVTSPWAHGTDREATRSAAAAVLAAGMDERPRRIAELCAVMSVLDERGAAAPEPLRNRAADITIAGLGIVAGDQLTRETEQAVRDANEVLYVETSPATADLLGALCPRVTSLFATSYAEDAPRLDAYRRMASQVIEAALAHPPVVFALQGHAIVGGYAPFLIRDLAEALGLSVRVLPGVSSLDCLFSALMLDPMVTGLQVYEATDLLLRDRPLQPDVPALICQVGNLGTRLYTSRASRPERFDPLVAHLSKFYPPDHVIAAVWIEPHGPAIHSFPIAQLGDHAEILHPGVTLYVPAGQQRPIRDAGLLAGLDSRDALDRVAVSPRTPEPAYRKPDP